MSVEKQYAAQAQSFINGVLFSSKYIDLVESLKKEFHAFQSHLAISLHSNMVYPRYEAIRKKLDEVLKTGNVLLKKKEVKSAKQVYTALKTLLRTTKKRKAEVVRDEKEYEKKGRASGLIEVDILITARDFANQPMNDAVAEIVVDSAPKKAKLLARMSKGMVRFKGIMVEPDGNLHLKLKVRRKSKNILSNNLIYRNLRQRKPLAISATEEFTKIEVTETSGKKAVNSVNAKGSVGVDFKVVKGGTEISTAKGLEKSTGRSEKYTLFFPKGTMKLVQK
ncbi:hypothetical protein [Ruegeria sp. HKCCD8929]|uniref:hypothetical protein n=1 Tax=Ruegeria sp. HKCCD8929 TaxID=2683006 RepID=UPI0014892068|nr:hypothetical protein [Ruegeria sp. HKCCD8929]